MTDQILLTISDPKKILIGIDEAGRGCWAGPVVAGAVWFKPHQNLTLLAGLNDSKKLKPSQRAALVAPIKDFSYWGVGEATAEEIDTINILQATFLAMQRALDALLLQAKKESILFDGVIIPEIQVDGSMIPKIAPQGWAIDAIIKGDSKMGHIAAASILAKEHRDGLMSAMDDVYPGYGFSQHKSYGTPAHMAALKKLGPCAIHRKSFKPIADFYKKD